MSKTLNASYRDEKNKMEGTAPIRLFEIEYGDSEASKIYWAAWNENVSYFLPGTATPQTYVAAPVEISSMKYARVDRTPTMSVTVSNVDRSMIAYLEQNDALRGRAVTLLRVFESLLDNSNAYVSETYYVDGGMSSRDSAKITLVPKSTIYNIKIPKRLYRRDQCQWSFLSLQCAGTATVNATTTNATMANPSNTTCLKTLASCLTNNNVYRYGGYPGIPKLNIRTPI
jgi:lambda family phage minor tail protein L